MRWLVSGRILKEGRQEGMARFGRELLFRVQQCLSDHQWIIAMDGLHSRLPYRLPNVREVRLPISADNPIGMLVYLEFWLPLTARRWGAQAIFAPDGWLPLTSGIPLIPVIHDLNFEVEPSWIAWHWRHLYRFYFRRIASKAHRIVTVSEFSRQAIHKLYNVDYENINVVPNAPSDPFRPLSPQKIIEARRRWARGKPYIIAPAALHHRKNVRRLLVAYRKALAQNPDLPILVLTGGELWPDRETKALLNELTRNHQAVMVGPLSDDEIALAMGGAEATVYLSLYEGFGLPVVESGACGVPVVASDIPPLREVGDEYCYYVNPYNIDEIAEKILLCISDKNLKEKARHCSLKIREKFSWDKSAQQLIRIFLHFSAASEIVQ